MLSRAVEWHPTDDKFVAHSFTSRIELFDAPYSKRGQSLTTTAVIETASPVSCFNWAHAFYLLAAGSSTGNVTLIDWNSNQEVINFIKNVTLPTII